MKSEIKTIILPEGTFDVLTHSYDESDRSKLFGMYKKWVELSKELKSFGGRGINLPAEGLSEPAFCIEMNCIRIGGGVTGANTSWDCYDLKTSSRIQVKACSVLPDLSSFGPKSEWDELYFVDFYNKGNFDGTFRIFRIPNDLIYNHKVNADETFREQQQQKRRPRFSIYNEIILANNINPVKVGDLSLIELEI